jgi:hypothetical protein
MAGCRGKHTEVISQWDRLLHRMVRALIGNLPLIVLETMPLTISALLKSKSVTLSMSNQSASFRVTNANHAAGQVGALDFFLKQRRPNLVNFLSQIYHIANRNICLAIQYQRIPSAREVHRNDARNSNLLAGWERGFSRRGLPRTSAAAQTDQDENNESTPCHHRPNEDKISYRGRERSLIEVDVC